MTVPILLCCLFATTALPPLPADHVRIHYHRPDGEYSGWGVHVWLGAAVETSWTAPLPPSGRSDWGLYFDVPLAKGAARLGLIVHRGDTKDPGPDQFTDLAGGVREVWVVSGRTDLFTREPDVSAMAKGELSRLEAHWVDARTLLWNGARAGEDVALLVSAEADLRISADGVSGARSIALAPAGVWRAEEGERFPHLYGTPSWRIPDASVPLAGEWLRGQVAIVARDENGSARRVAGVQVAGVLDDLFTYAGPLGLRWVDGVPELDLWAPTARSVRLLVFDDPAAETPAAQAAMLRGERQEPGGSGVWSLRGRPEWKGRPYLYEIEVYVPSTGRIETHRVTDPYARGLSRNSARSLFLDLDDPALAPPGWSTLEKPRLDAPLDIVLYELHLRDLSAADQATPEPLRGTYLAFTRDTPPTRHLRRLAANGVTHVHLLPVFDIATIDEDRATWPVPPDLAGLPPDSDQQQARLSPHFARDGYNWGYDPYHYGVPEGSYSTDPDGPARVLEFRSMVQALNSMGLRVVMDVVYNHTHASGVDPRAVFDRIVPGYYHRLDEAGNVYTSTCCANTASEHAMMERFIGDDLVHWARDYKIDGFRFDLMGHHLRRNLEVWRDRLHGLTREMDGVQGSDLYLYGEGWDFGEMQGGRRGVNATQVGLFGAGIGSFNDRIRDAVRGGNPFGDRREQGFATGLFVQPAWNGGTELERARLRDLTDRIRIGMAGNLADYEIEARDGRRVRGADLGATGYAAGPLESIQYVSAHDNETLFDKVLYAAPPDLPLEEKLRMHTLALSVVALSQGIPFFDAGSEILRSKGFDADSYDSGDWWNALDFTYQDNGFGRGLPPAAKNRDRWDIVRPLLGRADQKPSPLQIETAFERFLEFLRIRTGSPLFRLRTAEEIRERVRFFNTGPRQTDALIVMSIEDDPNAAPRRTNLDPLVRRIVVLVNAHPEEQSFTHPGLHGRDFRLHAVQATSVDERTRASRFDPLGGRFVVPGRTTAVFVEPE